MEPTKVFDFWVEMRHWSVGIGYHTDAHRLWLSFGPFNLGINFSA